MSTKETDLSTPVDPLVIRRFQDEIDAVGFAEDWIRAHKDRLGDWGSSFEWLQMSDGHSESKLFVYWFKGEIAGTATILRDEHNWTLINATMFK